MGSAATAPVILLSINRDLIHLLSFLCNWTVYAVIAYAPELRDHSLLIVCGTDSSNRRWFESLWSSISSLHSLMDCCCFFNFCFFLIFIYIYCVLHVSLKPTFLSNTHFSKEKRWSMIWSWMKPPSPPTYFLEAQRNMLSFLSRQRWKPLKGEDKKREIACFERDQETRKAHKVIDRCLFEVLPLFSFLF